LVIGAAMLSARPARADDTHYQDFVVGGRAMVLAGAFAAIADDPSGIYYNPAGIADARNTSLQVSTSLYGFERSTIGRNVGVPVPGLETLDIKKFTELVIVPASAGFVSTFGQKDAGGERRHAYGLSVVVPSYRSFSASAAGDFATYQRRVTDRELWSGAGYGYRLSENLRVGVAGYYILRSVADREDVTTSQATGLVDADGKAIQQRFQAVTNDISFTNGSLLLIVGAKYKPAPGWSVGVALETPSLQVHSQASMQFTRAVSDPTTTPTPSSTFTVITPENARSQTKRAASLRGGVSYVSIASFTLSADATVTAPVEYTLIKGELPGGGSLPLSKLPFSPHVERRPVANFNIGGEYLIVREVSIGAGIYSDLSSAPHIREQSPNADQQPHVDMAGMTMSLGYFGDHTLSRLGVVYSFGHGQDVIPKSDIGRVLEQDQTFQRVPYAQSFFYVFLSSTFRY
jgi:hypothetical protein